MPKKYHYHPTFSINKELVKVAIQKHQRELFKLEGVNGISCGLLPGKKSIKEYCIDLHLDSAEHASKLPSYLKMTDENSEVIRIRIHKIISGKAESHAAQVGGRIANRANLFNQGTLGYFVKSQSSNEIFMMSCYHVLREEHDWNIFTPIGKEEIVDAKSLTGEGIGTLCFGFRNDRFDIGLARLLPGMDIQIPPGLKMRASTDVSPQDEYSETKVFISGINSPALYEGIVYNDEVTKRIDYSDKTSQVFEKLMSITRRTDSGLISLTKKGDSGALVFNGDMEAMGIIVGGDSQFSYAMHIKDIEKTIQVEIVK